MFRKFLAYYKPYKKIFALDLFCAIVGSLVDIVVPLIVSYMVNNVLSKNDMSLLMTRTLQVVFVLLVLYTVRMFCTNFITYIGHTMGMQMETDMRTDLFNKLSELPFSFYDNNNTGQMISRMTSDLFDVTELAHHGPEDIIISIIKILGALLILSRVNLVLTLCLFLMVVFIVMFSKKYNVKMKDGQRKSRVKVGKINESVLDSLSGIRVVKSFANENHEKQKFGQGNQEFLDAKRGFYKTMGIYTSVNGFFQGLMYVVVFLVGAICVYYGTMESQDIILFILYINMFLVPMRTLINFTEMYQKGFTGFSRMLEILDEDNEIEDPEDPIKVSRLHGDIAFSNVSFKYKTSAEFVLEDITLKINQGEKVAIVGASGGGKSTFCSLIPRFYDTTSGAVTIDNIDVKKLALKELRQNIGVVQQDVYIFNTSIKENIAYGTPNATFEEIVDAAKNANIHDYIMTLPEGYDTYIGERGVRFSGGQKQRISIARIFLKNPPILILDEATAALDNESERFIQKSLDDLSKNRTTIIIAHRLSTVRNADEIIVLTDDGIIERGTHDLLMKKDGQYKKLYDLQFELL